MLAGVVFRLFDILLNCKDDVDRVNRCGSIFLFSLFATCLALIQYFGEPISCWLPAQFSKGWEQYAENYCFVESTYYLPIEERIPTDLRDRQARVLRYYQWVPYILGLQGLAFMIPPLIWSSFGLTTGLDLCDILKNCKHSTKNGFIPDEKIPLIAKKVNETLLYYKEAKHVQSKIGRLFAKGYGVYMTMLFLAMKLLSFSILVIQFFFMKWFLGQSDFFWGIQIPYNFYTRGMEWQETGMFPRVTMCDFQVRQMGGNIHTWTVQCVLKMNAFYEKIYLLLWFWLVFLVLLSFCNLFYWLTILLIPYYKMEFIGKYLLYTNVLGSESDPRLKTFVNKVLRTDGVLIVRLMSRRSGEIVSCDVVNSLWKLKYGRQEETKDLDDFKDENDN